jgi:hypothetical protein
MVCFPNLESDLSLKSIIGCLPSSSSYSGQLLLAHGSCGKSDESKTFMVGHGKPDLRFSLGMPHSFIPRICKALNLVV